MSQLTNEELGQLPYEMLIETISLPSFEKSYSSCNSIWNPAGPFHIVFRPKRATENKNKANKIDSKVENYHMKTGCCLKEENLHCDSDV